MFGCLEIANVMGLRHSKSKTSNARSNAYATSTPVERPDGVVRHSPIHGDAVLTVGIIGDDGFLSAGADKVIVSYKWREGKVLQKWLGHSRDVTKVVYSPSMDCVCSGSRDKTARLWKRSGTEGSSVNDAHLTFTGHNLVVTGVAPVDVSRRLCTGGRDNSVRLWDTGTGECIREVTTSRNLVTHMVTIPSTETVIQASEDKSMRLWDTRTLEEEGVSNKKSYIQTCCDVSPDGIYCLSCSNGFSGQGCEATIWDVRNFKNPVLEFKGHSQTVSGCCFLPSSPQMFVTCSHDQTIRLWNQNTGACLSTLTLPGSKQLTSIAAQRDGSICVGSFETGVHVVTRQESGSGTHDLSAVCQF
ncbi:WD repeat-containing protein 31-like [Diadema setosum]|uniref:WD repeat-containing protein 31-like n=1 Tax=Diadema setosum TaxID=31175 RepID=UPI003B3ADECC